MDAINNALRALEEAGGANAAIRLPIEFGRARYDAAIPGSLRRLAMRCGMDRASTTVKNGFPVTTVTIEATGPAECGLALVREIGAIIADHT